MHGRQKTVKRCFDLMPFIEKVVIYSDEADGEFLNQFRLLKKAQFPNDSLSEKWNFAVKCLEDVDFDAVIFLGSDDYIDENFLQFVSERIVRFDLIGFKDIYFESKNSFYYWKGYEGSREGEPAGAGKTYTKSFLEKVGFDLFSNAGKGSLDGISWKRCLSFDARFTVESIRENGILLCDIKDGEGITPLEKIKGIVKICD